MVGFNKSTTGNIYHGWPATIQLYSPEGEGSSRKWGNLLCWSGRCGVITHWYFDRVRNWLEGAPFASLLFHGFQLSFDLCQFRIRTFGSPHVIFHGYDQIFCTQDKDTFDPSDSFIHLYSNWDCQSSIDAKILSWACTSENRLNTAWRFPSWIWFPDMFRNVIAGHEVFPSSCSTCS